MTGQELQNMFRLRVGNKNLLDDDFLGILNEGIRHLSVVGRNFNTFRNLYLSKTKSVPLYEDKTKGYYILLPELDTTAIEIEGEKERQGDKVFIDTSLVSIDGNKATINYIKPLDNLSSLSDDINLGVYNDALLNIIISNYYNMRTDSVELANFYYQKALTLLQL